MLETVNLHLQEKGVRITTGRIVDATIIHAPSSTKNRDQQRDPEMHQTKKGAYNRAARHYWFKPHAEDQNRDGQEIRTDTAGIVCERSLAGQNRERALCWEGIW